MTTEPEKPMPPRGKPLNWVRPESRLEKPDRAPGEVTLKGLQRRDDLAIGRGRGTDAPPAPRPPLSGGRRALLALAVLAAVGGGGWLSVLVLTPTYGKIVGYDGAQPPLELIQPPLNHASPAAVTQIKGVAQLYIEYHTDLQDMYWPEPATIVERPNCWLVAYARRVPIYQFLWVRQAIPPTDRYMFLSIDKKDLSLRFGKWCE